MAAEAKFICVDKSSGRQLSIGWYDSAEDAESSIAFFSKDRSIYEPLCENCGKPACKPRDNPWTRAIVHEIQITGLPEVPA